MEPNDRQTNQDSSALNHYRLQGLDGGAEGDVVPGRRQAGGDGQGVGWKILAHISLREGPLVDERESGGR